MATKTRVRRSRKCGCFIGTTTVCGILLILAVTGCESAETGDDWYGGTDSTPGSGNTDFVPNGSDSSTFTPPVDTGTLPNDTDSQPAGTDTWSSDPVDTAIPVDSDSATADMPSDSDTVIPSTDSFPSTDDVGSDSQDTAFIPDSESESTGDSETIQPGTDSSPSTDEYPSDSADTGDTADTNTVDTGDTVDTETTVDTSDSDTEPDTETSLYKKYKNYFPIGAAIDGNSYRDGHAAILKEHFNSVVCENEMKWTALEPSEGSFNFSQADQMVKFAEDNNMLVRGHVLVWFDQTPTWVFQNASKSTLIQRMKNHITSVMNHYKGRIYAWDVVNEAVTGNKSNGEDAGEDLSQVAAWGYRNSQWYQIAGEDFIFEAFRAARAADPNAKLFYNDFWNYLDGKREFIMSFVKRLKEEGIIDGIGLQCHLNISPAQEVMTNQTVYQTVENFEKEIQEYAALGLEVHVTEMDISIYTRDYTSDDQSRWYTGYLLNDDYQNRLADRYKEFFDMFRKNKDLITNVTLWGIADDNTWLSEFPSGRPDQPLLFDKNLQPKKAFYSVMDF